MAMEGGDDVQRRRGGVAENDLIPYGGEIVEAGMRIHQLVEIHFLKAEIYRRRRRNRYFPVGLQ
jgi:hypothetical protein